MSGYLFSCKTTLAKEIWKHCHDATAIVESDVVRSYVAEKKRYKTPKYNSDESMATFKICHELIRIGIFISINVVFDATNLQESNRYV